MRKPAASYRAAPACTIAIRPTDRMSRRTSAPSKRNSHRTRSSTVSPSCLKRPTCSRPPPSRWRRQRCKKTTTPAGTASAPHFRNTFQACRVRRDCDRSRRRRVRRRRCRRNHGGVPKINLAEHRLLVHGMVDSPRVFTIDDLKRYPPVSVLHFIECAGNGLTEWAKPTGKTVQITHGLLSCAEWTGVKVSTLLKYLGVKPGAAWVLAEGADAALMDRSIPIEKLMDDAILAYGQNGEALRPEQGYPLRLLLPGFEGNMNIKWLRRLKVGREPFYTREETSKYTDVLSSGEARMFTFVMEAKSVITRPSGGLQLQAKGDWPIAGLAWNGRGKIRRVEV